MKSTFSDLDRKKLYKAVVRRDPKFDGRFYFGVTSTKIYCRPVCPAKPSYKNILFFKSKAEAESQSFRPCLRCRPDLSPLSPQWHGSASVIARALNYISENSNELSRVAERVGMTDRHLRRLFQMHVGASPIQLALSQRLHLARQLISQTEMKLIDIALASGFQSVRRFNDAFKKSYRTSPSAYRKNPNGRRGPLIQKLSLPFVQPWNFKNHFASLQRHQIAGVELISSTTLERNLRIHDKPCWLRVTIEPTAQCLNLEFETESLEQVRPLFELTRRAFDLTHNPLHLELPEETPSNVHVNILGARIPGSFDDFEVGVCQIIGQAVSTEAAKSAFGKLVEQFSAILKTPWNAKIPYLFPTPAELHNRDLTSIGITQSKALAIQHFAQLWISGEIETLKSKSFTEIRSRLISIPGVGDWTAEMICLRCFNDPDAFPTNDLILKRAITSLGLDIQKFSPHKAYLAVALWQMFFKKLSKKGKIK